jgi:hypothetical protein
MANRFLTPLPVMQLSRSFSKAVGEFGRRHLYVSQNSSKSANLEWAIAMNRHGGSQIAAGKKVVTPTYAKQLKALALQKLRHLLTTDARQFSHVPIPPSRVRWFSAEAVRVG